MWNRIGLNWSLSSHLILCFLDELIHVPADMAKLHQQPSLSYFLYSSLFLTHRHHELHMSTTEYMVFLPKSWLPWTFHILVNGISTYPVTKLKPWKSFLEASQLLLPMGNYEQDRWFWLHGMSWICRCCQPLQPFHVSAPSFLSCPPGVVSSLFDISASTLTLLFIFLVGASVFWLFEVHIVHVLTWCFLLKTVLGLPSVFRQVSQPQHYCHSSLTAPYGGDHPVCVRCLAWSLITRCQ